MSQPTISFLGSKFQGFCESPMHQRMTSGIPSIESLAPARLWVAVTIRTGFWNPDTSPWDTGGGATDFPVSSDPCGDPIDETGTCYRTQKHIQVTTQTSPTSATQTETNATTYGKGSNFFETSHTIFGSVGPWHGVSLGDPSKSVTGTSVIWNYAGTALDADDNPVTFNYQQIWELSDIYSYDDFLSDAVSLFGSTTTDVTEKWHYNSTGVPELWTVDAEDVSDSTDHPSPNCSGTNYFGNGGGPFFFMFGQTIAISGASWDVQKMQPALYRRHTDLTGARGAVESTLLPSGSYHYILNPTDADLAAVSGGSFCRQGLAHTYSYTAVTPNYPAPT